MAQNERTRQQTPNKATGVQPVNTTHAEAERSEVVEVIPEMVEHRGPGQPRQGGLQNASPQAEKHYTAAAEQMTGPEFFILGPLGNELCEAAMKFARENRGLPRLNVILETYGGDPDFTFNSAVILRESCDKLVVYVPRRAKSAGTLFCLAADEIVLFLGSELGPLDSQVQDPRESTQTISALTGYRALATVANFLHDELETTAKQLIGAARASVSDALKFAIKFIDPMSRPLFEQINPLDLGAFGNALEVSNRYGRELLRRFGKQEKDKKVISAMLVRNYPSHTYVIDLHEATRIGLRARRPNTDETNRISSTYVILKKELALRSYYGLLQDLDLGADK